MQRHELKIAPEDFRAVWEDRERSVLRYDDRGYRIGDVLLLREFKDGEYTGSRLAVKVTHILRSGPGLGLQEGWCILSFIHVGKEKEEGDIVKALRTCSVGAPCADCPQKPKRWNCDWKLMGQAADLIEHMELEVHNYRKALEAVETRLHKGTGGDQHG